MRYAGVHDLEARLGRTLTESESAQAAVLLDDASVYLSALIKKRNIGDEYARILKMVVCNMVARSLSTPEDMYGASQQSMTAGPYTQQITYSTPRGDFYLTRTEKRLLGIGGGRIHHLRADTHDRRRHD